MRKLTLRGVVALALVAAAVGAAASAPARSGVAPQIALVGTGAPVTGDFTPSATGGVLSDEFAGVAADDGASPEAFAGSTSTAASRTAARASSSASRAAPGRSRTRSSRAGSRG